MTVPEWYFGPAGDLQPLPVPEPGLSATVERFGGVHQAITGARTVDTLGHKAKYELELRALEPADYYRLESLFLDTAAGRLWLVDPLRRNLLSRTSWASDTVRGGSTEGLTGTNCSLSPARLANTPIPWNRRSVRARNFNPSAPPVVHFEAARRAPVREGEPVTFSVYAWPTQDAPIGLRIRFFNSEGVSLSGDASTAAPVTRGVWTRVSHTAVAPASAALAYAELFLEAGTWGVNADLYLTSPQLELSPGPTDAVTGGAAVVCAIESLDATSPRYPIQDVSLTLLEV